jgi:phosphoglycerate dehydrogenase-like enzyme
MKYRVLIAESMDEEMLAQMQATTSKGVFDYKPNLSVAELEQELAGYDGLIVRPKQVTEAAIVNAPNLRLIIRGGAGVNSIALDAAKNFSVVVENTPALNSQATAEFAFLAMMKIFCNRQISRSAHLALKGAAGLPEDFMGSELRGKKLGIVGLGNVGARLAAMATAFGMEVFCYARTPKDLQFKQTQDLQKLLSAGNDIISLHLPLSPATNGIIGAAEFARMKHDTVLINTARPQLVNVEAFAQALENGVLASYAIDGDQDQIQPFIEADKKKRGICTHHISDCTFEAHAAITKQTMHQAIEFFENKKEINRVV